jgi:hypothetical protein
MNAHTRKITPKTRGPQPPKEFDEADWVDWDHWQTVEEIQNFMNGLAGGSDSLPETADASEDEGRIARQIRRHGLQADG